jgi:hypothetical protein
MKAFIIKRYGKKEKLQLIEMAEQVLKTEVDFSKILKMSYITTIFYNHNLRVNLSKHSETNKGISIFLNLRPPHECS